MESSRKQIVKVVRYEPVTPGRDSEKKGDYMGGDLPLGGEWSKMHIGYCIVKPHLGV